jgi:cell division protein FtsL
MADAPRRNQRQNAKAKAKAAKRDAKPRRARRPSMRLALFLVVLVGLLFAFVYPTRTFLDQRDETNKARAQLELLQTENARLARESKQLSTDAEIERLAREKYGLVKPGERSFVVLPAPSSSVPPPSSTLPPAP